MIVEVNEIVIKFSNSLTNCLAVYSSSLRDRCIMEMANMYLIWRILKKAFVIPVHYTTYAEIWRAKMFLALTLLTKILSRDCVLQKYYAKCGTATFLV